LAAVDLSVRVLTKMRFDLLLHPVDLVVEGGQTGMCAPRDATR
jgi:hypothetical protein